MRPISGILLNITRNDDGRFEITDQRGKVVEGPFETNAAAWAALDRLDTEQLSSKPKSRKKVLWGKPKTGKPPTRKQKKRQERVDKEMRRNAAKAPNWVRAVAARAFDPAGERKYRDFRLGTFGAASEVKRIDPATYLAEKAAKE